MPEAWMPMRVQTDKQESFEMGETKGAAQQNSEDRDKSITADKSVITTHPFFQ